MTLENWKAVCLENQYHEAGYQLAMWSLCLIELLMKSDFIKAISKVLNVILDEPAID